MRNILYQIIREEDKPLLTQKGVYQIKNKENNKVYIGSTSLKFSKRLTAHIRELIENRHHSIHLQNSFNQSKKFEKFEISILEICETEFCIESEQKWIDFYQSYNDKFGYNISPTAGSCFGLKKSEEEKLKIFERSRKISDEKIIKMFHLRNELNFSYRQISIELGITRNQVGAILTKQLKYKSVKNKYKLELKNKFKKEFNKEDVIKIHNLYEKEKFSISDISNILGISSIKIRHLIYNENIYREERENLKFNIESNRKSKMQKEKAKRVKKVKITEKKMKNIININQITEVFDLKHNLNLSEQEICEKISISEKELELILAFRYQRRKYNQIYLDLKTKYDLRKKKNTLTEQDIINIFEDYNSGDYLIEDLSVKYDYNDIGVLFSNRRGLSSYYQEIIQRNDLKVNKSLTKNIEMKSEAITNRNKQRSKSYKLTDPSGKEIIIKNLAEFCKGTDLDPANFSRVAKNGKKYKGWKCQCLD